MKFLTLVLSILPLLALANPVAEPEPEPEPAAIEKRAQTCALTGSDVRYHTKPDSTSPAPGQFGAKGTKVPFSCYTTGTGKGAVVNGDNLWNKVASGKGAGYYVSNYYITDECAEGITVHC